MLSGSSNGDQTAAHRKSDRRRACEPFIAAALRGLRFIEFECVLSNVLRKNSTRVHRRVELEFVVREEEGREHFLEWFQWLAELIGKLGDATALQLGSAGLAKSQFARLTLRSGTVTLTQRGKRDQHL